MLAGVHNKIYKAQFPQNPEIPYKRIRLKEVNKNLGRECEIKVAGSQERSDIGRSRTYRNDGKGGGGCRFEQERVGCRNTDNRQSFIRKKTRKK